MKRLVSLLCIAVVLLGFLEISEGLDLDHGSLNWPNPQWNGNPYQGETGLAAGINLFFPQGQRVSVEELGSITGKGLPKAHAGLDSRTADKIILWDEARFLRPPGASFSSQSTNSSNRQTNQLILHGQ